MSTQAVLLELFYAYLGQQDLASPEVLFSPEFIIHDVARRVVRGRLRLRAGLDRRRSVGLAMSPRRILGMHDAQVYNRTCSGFKGLRLKKRREERQGYQ